MDPCNIEKVNMTDICLIPKVDKPEFIEQFRPISLCNTIYKIVTKVIVNRLKEVIPGIVSPYQTGFVPRRKIQENIIIAQEMAHNMAKRRGKLGFFAIKVDLSKAYDKLSWSFIWQTLEEIGFPDDLVHLIMFVATSVNTNVKWNGQRSEFFKLKEEFIKGILCLRTSLLCASIS